MYIKIGQNVLTCHSIVQYNLFQIKINNFKLIHILLLFSHYEGWGLLCTCYMVGSMPLAFTQEDFLVHDCIYNLETSTLVLFYT